MPRPQHPAVGNAAEGHPDEPSGDSITPSDTPTELLDDGEPLPEYLNDLINQGAAPTVGPTLGIEGPEDPPVSFALPPGPRPGDLNGEPSLASRLDGMARGVRLTDAQREEVAKNLVMGISPTTIARAMMLNPDYIKRLDKYDADLQKRKAKWHHIAIRSMSQVQLNLRDLVPRSLEHVEDNLRPGAPAALETAKFVIRTVIGLDQAQRTREEPPTVRHQVTMDAEVSNAFAQIGKLAEAIGSGPSPAFAKSLYQGTSSLITPGELERVEAPTAGDPPPNDSKP